VGTGEEIEDATSRKPNRVLIGARHSPNLTWQRVDWVKAQYLLVCRDGPNLKWQRVDHGEGSNLLICGVTQLDPTEW